MDQRNRMDFFIDKIALRIIVKFLLHSVIEKRKSVAYIIGKEQK